jgi:DNA polymerase III psi subunit
VFPFTSNPAAFKLDKQFKLLPDQLAAKALAKHFKQTDISDKSFVYAHPYLSEVLALDHFDTAHVKQLNAEKLTQLKENEIVIWDNWFSVVELGLTKEFMNEQTQLKRLEEFKTPNGEVFFVVYKRI